MKAKLSVVVPVYNVQQYLSTCLDSIINQTYADLEIIIVNDGSTDDSAEICNQYLHDKRIQVYHKTNEGLSEARNFGATKATSKYITFLDSDDYIHPETYSEMMNQLLEQDADLVIADFMKVPENCKDMYEYNSINYDILSTKEAFSKFYTLECDSFTVAWNKIYLRESILNLPFPYGMLHEDEFTSYKHILQSSKIVYIRTPLYFYRQRSTSIMNRAFNIKSLDSLIAFDERKQIVTIKYPDFSSLENTRLTNYIFSLNRRKNLSFNDMKIVQMKSKKFLEDIIDFNTLSLKEKVKYILVYYFQTFFIITVSIKKCIKRSKK